MNRIYFSNLKFGTLKSMGECVVIMLFVLTTLSFNVQAQSSGYSSLVETQKLIHEYQEIYATLDVSTPEGMAIKAKVDAKIAALVAISNHFYGGLSTQEQMAFQSWVSDVGISAGAPSPSPELAARMDQMGIPYISNASGNSNSNSSSGSSANPIPNGPFLFVP